MQAQLTGNTKIPGDPHDPANVCLDKKVEQLMVQTLMLLIWRICMLAKQGDNNLLLCGAYSEYDTTKVDLPKHSLM
jgi:hypothetical protein